MRLKDLIRDGIYEVSWAGRWEVGQYMGQCHHAEDPIFVFAIRCAAYGDMFTMAIGVRECEVDRNVREVESDPWGDGRWR